MFVNPGDAKRNLAINLYWETLHQKDHTGYAWLAQELSKRYGKSVHVSRIQKILEQTSSPDWVTLMNLAEILQVSVETLARKPHARAVHAYNAKYNKETREAVDA